MGLPLISMAGKKHLARVGVSHLTNIGYPEWIADDRDQYVRIATELASDAERLNTIRQGLREKMSNSPLMDSDAFVAELEEKLIEIWQNRKVG